MTGASAERKMDVVSKFQYHAAYLFYVIIVKLAARRGAAILYQNNDLVSPTAANVSFDNIGNSCELSNDFDAEKSEDRVDDAEIQIRKMRATALVLAIRDAHPNDARLLLTVALIDLSAGMPSGAIFATVREDARWWAGLATPAELMEVLSAALDNLRSRAMHLEMRKRLFMWLWRSSSPKQQGDFLSFVKTGVRNDYQ